MGHIFSCRICTEGWGGQGTCHCISCHETFTGHKAFDAHRTGSHTVSGEKTIDKGSGEPRGPRRCLPPATVGLESAGRSYPCWGFPGAKEAYWNEGSARAPAE